MSAALEQAEALLDVGRPAQAGDVLARHLATAPDDAYALCLLSRARLGTGATADALEVALRAVALAPDAEWPHRLASIALLHTGQVSEAVRAAREAVRLEPDDWRTHVQLARALCAPTPLSPARPATAPAMPPAQEAWGEAVLAVSLAPLEPRTHLAVGDVARAGGHYAMAEQAYRRTLELDPGNAVALNALASAGEAQGRLIAAAGGFAAAAAADPREAAPAHNLVAIGWELARRLPLSMAVLAFLTLGTIGDPNRIGEGLAPAAGVPLVATATGGLLVVWLLIVRRLPRSMRPVLRRTAARGWGLATTVLFASGLALLLAAPWPLDGQLRAVLAALALGVFFLTFVVARLGSQAHETAYDRRHG